MGKNRDEMPVEDAGEERAYLAFDPDSEEGVRLFNEILDEGSAYISAVGCTWEDDEMYLDDEPATYRDPDLCDPDEETLPPGELEMIFENSFIF